MIVPYFTKESESSVFKKLKLMFLVKKLQISDILLLAFGVIPFLINFVWYMILKGSSDFSKVFLPFLNFFDGKGMVGWNSFLGYLHLVFLFLSLSYRIYLGYVLWKKLKNYEKLNEGFKWRTLSIYMLSIFIPFLSFFLYLSLLKSSKTEFFHKYNL